MFINVRPEELATVFRTEPAIVAAWLFGSVAAGRPTPFSDIDFAVLLRPDAPQGLDRFVLLDRLARRLAELLGVSEQKVDVATLDGPGCVFPYEVVRTGKLLYEADRKARELFVWRVYMRYLDFQPTLEIYDRTRARSRAAARSVARTSRADAVPAAVAASKDKI